MSIDTYLAKENVSETKPLLSGWNNYVIAEKSQQSNVREISSWRNTATMIMAGLLTSSNASVVYAGRVTTALTNPSVWLDTEYDSALFADDDMALKNFISFIDSAIDKNPDLVVSADKAQLDRIASLIGSSIS